MPVVKQIIKKSPLAPTVLIAGGAGFIGSNLAETLLLKDARVIVVDNFKTGKKSYVDHLLKNDKFALFDADISIGLPDEIGSVDYIFHLAGLEPYIYGTNDINLDTLMTNALGTKNLLDLANRSPAKFLLASSVNIYQGVMSPVNLDSYFGQSAEEEKKFSLNEAKRFAEAIVWEYYKKNDTDVRVVRLPEVYGPKMDFESCGNLGVLLQDLVKRNSLTVYGEGLDKEYYLYITDAVSGLIKSLFNKSTSSKIFSLVGKEPYTVLEIAYILKGLSDRETDLHFKPRPKTFEFFEFRPPETSTLSALKWEQKIPLKDGLVKTLEWAGYRVNEYAFKPAKLIEEKQKEKISVQSIQTDDLPSLTVADASITSLVGEAAPAEVSPSALKPVTELPQSRELNFIEPATPLSHHRLKFLARKPKMVKLPNLPKVQFLAKLPIRKEIVLGLVSAVFAFSFFFILIPGLTLYYNAKSAVDKLQTVPTLMGQLDSASAREAVNMAFNDLTMAQNSLANLKWVFTLTNKREEYKTYYKLITSSRYFTKSLYNLSKASVPFNSLWDTVKPDSTSTITEEQFGQSKLDLDTAKNNLLLAQAELQNINTQLIPDKIKDNYEQYTSILSVSSEAMELITQAADAAGDLAGLKTPKKYLILFQNSNELRPTGGFIGSYALLELDKGKISSLTIDDIYNPDGQIDVRGIKQEPSAQIKEFLKEDRMYIRNANWNPSFPDSAQTISDLFQKVTGVRVDGVIGVDLYFAQNLLDVTGPLFLTAYNEEISAANLYERAQLHSEFNYTAGSEQKKSFLTILGSKLLEKIFALPKESIPNLVASLSKSLGERHVMVYLPSNPFAVALNKYKADGSLVATTGDYLYVVNANLGGTKANYFVTNAINYEVLSVTRDGVLRARTTLTYNHTGVDMAWPGGPYTDYVRVIAQQGSKLTGAKVILNTAEPKDIVKDVVIGKEGSYESFGTSFKLNPKETIKLVFEYDLPKSTNIVKGTNLNYALYVQKQPGTKQDKLDITFDLPFGFELNGTNPADVKQDNGKLILDTTLNSDKQLVISLK